MIIKSIELCDFRNYEKLNINFDNGTNILYGDNAQGKTNILEAAYLSGTTKSHKGSKDKEMIRFDGDDAHIRTIVSKKGKEYQIDMHLRKRGSKGVAINKVPIKKASELFGILNIVFLKTDNIIRENAKFSLQGGNSMAALSVNSYSSLGSKKGMEGLMSGLETSEIVKAYTSNTRNRIQTQMQKRQQEQWKQQQLQEITKKIQTYYNKYFSYSSSNNIFSSKFFDTSKIESSNSKVSATGDSQAVKNLQIKNVSSLASAATLTSTHKISTQSMSTGEIKTDWQENSFAGSSFTFDIGGVDTTIEIASDFKFTDAAMADAERSKGIDRHCISHVIHGRNKTAGGYTWKQE